MQTGAPPPPGIDTPVPADATSRAAAGGRVRRPAAAAEPATDRLVPARALETRAEERARLRREQLAVAPIMPASYGVANPAAGLAPHTPSAPAGQIMPSGYGLAPYGSAAPVQYWPHGTYGAYAGPQHGQYGPPQYGPPLVVVAPPRIRWTRRQRTAALLSSWLGQTLMALATHFVVASALIVGWAYLLHVSGDDVAEFEADSFTTVVSLWSTPDRVWATALICLLIGGVVLALGWLVNALWARSAGLAKPHRSAWLAWVCTTAATGLIGFVVWPLAFTGGMVVILASDSASFTMGSMWSMLFGLLAVAIVLTGGAGLLFGWLFLSTSRPRVDVRALAEAEEAAARARDEAELGMRPNGEPWR